MKKHKYMKKYRRPRVTTMSVPEDQYKLFRSVWILRTLVNTPAHKEFVRKDCYEDDSFMSAIGLRPIVEPDITDKTVLKVLKKELAKLETEIKQKGGKPCTLFKNIRKLKQKMNLTNSQEEILAFFTMIKNEKALEEALDFIGDINGSRMNHILSEVLNYSRETIIKDLDKNNALISSGVVKLEKVITYFSSKFELLEGLEDLLLKENTSSSEILDSFYKKSKQTELTISSFPHLKADIDILVPVIKSAQKEQTEGINILIYGIPGTGKTELVKAVAKALKTKLYEINVEDMDGDPISGQVRFKAYQLCQKLLQRADGIIMFDEIEDVFPESTNFVFFRENSGAKKGWINKLLESNCTPTFWISNSVRQMDPAYLRRFGYVLEIKTPPRPVRSKIIRKCLTYLDVGQNYIEQLAKNEYLTPAQIENAAKITKLAKPTSTSATEQIINKVINNDMNLRGIPKRVNNDDKNRIEYSLDYLNSDYSLKDLIAGLERNPSGRICLYGYPGTGKTAFAHYMADRLNKPIIEKRASDLLDKFVGGTEKNIASMFDQTKQDDALLLLDEADSFLQDRSNAFRSWEITQVNEILVQMENYKGIFFCSTNLMDNLDSASLRRFDLKIKFDYMTPEQTWQLFLQAAKEFGKPMADQNQNLIKRRVDMLNNLTPGDFAVISRQSQFRDSKMTVHQLIEVLSKESFLKPDSKQKTIGFSP
jgi:transitional endoplasmic reticulum ATPase